MSGSAKSGIRGSVWVLVLVLSCICQGQVIYVDAAAVGANDGSSWQNACKYLQDALAAAAVAAKPLEIRVAQGVYKPDQGTGITPGDRAATFQLLNGVTLKGGYAGTAGPDPNARDVGLYETTLSGDLAGNDAELKDFPQSPQNIDPTWTDNSFRIVTGSGTDATASLDGFTITGGCAVPPAPSTGLTPPGGAGLCNETGSPTIVQCVFRTNYSFFYGGAVYNHAGSPAFSRCTFERNGSNSRGGAMHNNNAAPTLTDCTFIGNVAKNLGWWGGGAILNEWYSHTVLKNCVFTENESAQGGAIYNGPVSDVELDNCRFDRNRTLPSGAGGAIYSHWGDLTMTGCTFDQNFAVWDGGAVQMSQGTLLVSRCTFTGNTVDTEKSSPFGGGALCCEGDAVATVADTKFEGNTAGYGGAVYTTGYYMDVSRCTFVDNVAGSPTGHLSGGAGGAFYSRYTWAHLTDCTFSRNRAGNTGGALCGGGSKKVFVTRCDFTRNEAQKGGALVADEAAMSLANCLFSGNRADQGGAIFTWGILSMSSQVTMDIRNCTFAGNIADDGLTLACDARKATVDFSHCILWDGPDALWSKYPLQANVIYSDVQGGHAGEGNIDLDPGFVSPGHWSDPNDPNAVWIAGDYHLQSQAGHWDRQTEAWVRDNQTSPCIDAGNPAQPFEAEPFPNGGIVNLGAYGGTPEASNSYFGGPICETVIAGDINGDCKVDATDLALSAQPWRASPVLPPNQPPTVVISQPSDGAVIDLSPSNTIVNIVADAADSDGSIEEVRFFAEQRTQEYLLQISPVADTAADGWQWSWDWHDAQTPHPEGQYTIQAYAVDDDGALVFSPKITVTIHMTK